MAGPSLSPPCHQGGRAASAKGENRAQRCFPHGKGEGWTSSPRSCREPRPRLPLSLGALWGWGAGASEKETWWDRDGGRGRRTAGMVFSNLLRKPEHRELTGPGIDPQKSCTAAPLPSHTAAPAGELPTTALSPPRGTEPLLNNSGRRVPSVGAADKRGKWLRNGACPSGATSAPGGRAPLLPAGPAGGSGPARVRARGGGDGAELPRPPEQRELHFTAGQAGIPSRPRAPGACRGDKI